MKIIRIFYLKDCHFLVVKFSVYLNRRVFIMGSQRLPLKFDCSSVLATPVMLLLRLCDDWVVYPSYKCMEKSFLQLQVVLEA